MENLRRRGEAAARHYIPSAMTVRRVALLHDKPPREIIFTSTWPHVYSSWMLLPRERIAPA